MVKAIPIVRLTTLPDQPLATTLLEMVARLRETADWIDVTVHYGTDHAERLLSDAALLESIALSIEELLRMPGRP